ncbi:MAG TPA: cold shock domain-containing protein [Pseudolabrys sp.]|jgi:CspA family cold shock protein
MQTGVIKFWNGFKGFGFIAPSNFGPDVFLHRSALDRAGIESLQSGDRVSFETRIDTRGKAPMAVNIAVLKDAA